MKTQKNILILFLFLGIILFLIGVWLIGNNWINERFDSIAKSSENKINKIHGAFEKNLSELISSSDCKIDKQLKEEILEIISDQDRFAVGNPKSNFINQIELLTKIKYKLANQNCMQAKEAISQQIGTLRILLLLQSDDIANANLNTSVAEVYSDFYIPDSLGSSGTNASEISKVSEFSWSDSCRVLNYALHDKSLIENYISDVLSFYKQKGYSIVDYDLNFPKEPSSIKTGWKKARGGKLWIQSWKSPDNEIINLNIGSSDNGASPHIILVYLNKEKAAPFLELNENKQKALFKPFEFDKK